MTVPRNTTVPRAFPRWRLLYALPLVAALLYSALTEPSPTVRQQACRNEATLNRVAQAATLHAAALPTAFVQTVGLMLSPGMTGGVR